MSEFEIWNELGDIHYNTGAYDQAVLIYQKVIAIDPSYSKSYCNLASIFIHQERYTEAIPMLQKGIEFTDEAIGKACLWNQLGDAYRKLQDFGNAAISYRKAIELSPLDPVFQKNLAEIETSSQVVSSESIIGDAEETSLPPALDSANETIPGLGAIVRPDPSHSEPECSEGEALNSEILSNRPETAGRSASGNACWVYKENKTALLLEQHPLAAPEISPMILGSRILSTAAIEEGVADKSQSLENNNVLEQEISEEKGEALSSANEEPEILLSSDETSSLNQSEPAGSPKPTPRALLRLGILHWRKGEYERALQFLRIAIDSSTKSQNQFIEALCYKAIALVDTDLGKIEQAIHAYQSAANLAPENIFPWKNLGNLNCMLARYDDARAAFQEAIEHNPKDSASWNGLGDVYHSLGRNEDAIAAYQLGNVFENYVSEKDALTEFEMAIESDQGNPQVWNEAGNIYFGIGLYREAIDSYRKAVELDPSNATFLSSLAKAEKALGQENSESAPPALQILTGKSPKALQPQESDSIPRKSSGLPEAVVDMESEPSYWVFDKVTSPGFSQQPATPQVPAVEETLLTDSRPSLDTAPQTHVYQAFSSDQVPQDTGQNHINVLVQLSPRPLKPATGASVNPSNSNYGRGRTSEETIPSPNQTCSNEMESGAGTSSLGSAEDNQAANQPSLDLQTLEKDIAAYRRVTELNPKNDRAWDALGSMFESVGLHDEAIAAFEQAIALCPRKEVYHYHLGMAHAYQTHFDKAILALQRVIELNPDYVLAHCALAGYYRKLGMETEAQEHIKKARPSMINESEYNQACFESISGNADRAFSLLEIALEKDQFQPAMVRNDPDLDFIRTDPRFEVLIQRNRIINL
jgi:tetratricopeptide (TPR) repeat protein